MKWFDITMPIEADMQVYKNRQQNKPVISVDRSHELDRICEHRLEINLHTGTHLDAPLHVLPDGMTIDSFPLELSRLPCTVIDLTDVRGGIMPADLPLQQIRPGSAVLIKTQNSYIDQFDPDYVFLTDEAARAAADQRPALIGIDALGIERGQPGHPTHKALFKENIWILEDLRLAAVDAGSDYFLNILPLNIKGKEASPVRAVLQWQE